VTPRPAESGRVAPILAPVVGAGFVVLAAATWTLATASLSLGEFAGILALVAAATVAEAFPVPIELEGIAAGGVSLAAVFIVGAAVVYGWAAAVVVAFVALTVIQVSQRRGLDRQLYNAAVYALSGAAAGVAASSVDNSKSVGALVVAVVLGSASFYATNVVLIAAVVARSAGAPVVGLLRRSVVSTAIPFSIMASVSLMLTVLLDYTPLLAAALVGPLVAVALYQRSAHEALQAMRLALTDPLTGLGNHRHFHDRLQRDLDRAQLEGTPLSVCLIDIDDFKPINDRHGHPVGDLVLTQVASQLRQGGEAFRLGGDEFALLLPGRGEKEALAIAELVLARVAMSGREHGGGVTMSAGIATYPEHGVDRSELLRIADTALYGSKKGGKGQVRPYRPDVVELDQLRRLVQERDRRARFLAATSLARAVDARDDTGEHSSEVGNVAARIAARMGLPYEEVELIRLAGSLHDVGKLALPEDVLRKPGPLNGVERTVLERHPQIGFRMLDSLGVEPVASWVLHHHERWDGGGYPDRLAGDGIPLGARILFVADAYDAMTTERVYRGRLSHEQAVRELDRCAGSQFDPGVVDAFKREFGDTRGRGLSAAAIA
jgi:diguanylate cyclase (GGDEF)-like protein/putative nucleotidyltransferase with HDIG domain